MAIRWIFCFLEGVCDFFYFKVGPDEAENSPKFLLRNSREPENTGPGGSKTRAKNPAAKLYKYCIYYRDAAQNAEIP